MTFVFFIRHERASGRAWPGGDCGKETTAINRAAGQNFATWHGRHVALPAIERMAVPARLTQQTRGSARPLAAADTCSTRRPFRRFQSQPCESVVPRSWSWSWSVYSITTFIRDMSTLLQIRQVAQLRSTTCNLLAQKDYSYCTCEKKELARKGEV